MKLLHTERTETDKSTTTLTAGFARLHPRPTDNTENPAAKDGTSLDLSHLYKKG
jgi:hypothetical protein